MERNRNRTSSVPVLDKFDFVLVLGLFCPPRHMFDICLTDSEKKRHHTSVMSFTMFSGTLFFGEAQTLGK